MNEVTLTTPACLLRLRTTPAEMHAIAERLGLFPAPPAPVFRVRKRKMFRTQTIVSTPLPLCEPTTL